MSLFLQISSRDEVTKYPSPSSLPADTHIQGEICVGKSRVSAVLQIGNPRRKAKKTFNALLDRCAFDI